MQILQLLAAFLAFRALWRRGAMAATGAALASFMLIPAVVHTGLAAVEYVLDLHLIVAALVLAPVGYGYVLYRRQRAVVDAYFDKKQKNISLKRRIGPTP